MEKKKNEITIRDNFYLRIPRYSKEIYENYYDSSSDELLNFYKKSFKEEVLVESKELYEACENGNQDINKVVSSLRKYVIRSSTRCTPFGLNAAVVRGKFSNFNDFKVDTKKFKKEPFIDYQWYVNLINLLEWNLGDNLLVTLNNTIEINNDVVLNNWLDSYKYNKKNAINVFLNNTNALKIIIRKTNRKFISIKELKSCLKYQYPNIDQNTLDAFFKDLMNNQVLISNLKGNTIIDNKLEDLIIKLKNYNVDSKIIENINEIIQLLKQYKNTKINAGENTYLKIINKMKNIVKSENYICVNLYNDSIPKLNYEIKDSIKDYVDLLIRFSDKNGYENNYYDNFIDKFGNQAVNVNIVFDDTLGIGYPSKKKLNKTKNFYLLQEFLFNHFGDIIIDDLIPYLDEGNQGDLLGNELSLNIVGSSLKNYLVCNPLLGSNQNYKILGRFHKYENEYILDSEKKDIVEIVYFPKQSKIGNILNCHTNAKYYFEYGTNCEIKGKERVNLEDIYIMPSENKLKFINKKTSNYITFVVSNMVNIAFMPPILQSLLIISENGTSNLFNFFSMLNVIFKNHKIKPQIKYKNIIIQAKNLTITNEDSLKYNLNIIKKEFNNKLVLCGNEDNYILLNLNKKNNIDILNQLLKTEKKLNIRESFCEYNNFYIKDEFDKSYFSELVFEVESNKNQEEKEIIHVPEYSLNSNYLDKNCIWISFKLYMKKEYMHFFVKKYLFSIVNNEKTKRYIKKFFFINYFDSDYHIRFRILIDKNCIENIQYVVELYEKFVECKNNNIIKKIIINEYNPEINRYGGDFVMNEIESIFMFSSIISAKLISKLSLNNKNILEEEYYNFVLFQISSCYSETDKQINVMAQFKEYFQRKSQYDILKKKLILELIHNRDDLKIILANKIKDYEEYSKISKLLKDIKEKVNDDERFEGILISIFHMHFNRLLSINRDLENRLNALVENTLYSVNSIKNKMEE